MKQYNCVSSTLSPGYTGHFVERECPISRNNAITIYFEDGSKGIADKSTIPHYEIYNAAMKAKSGILNAAYA